MKNWKSLNEFFEALNNSTDYLVLRNFEEFTEGKIVSDHPDIDVLCSNRDEFLEIVSSESRSIKEDKIHRRVIIEGKRVDLDVRHVGDGYYDTQWEQNMLSTKFLYNNFCYVMNTENYYYSLLYHALIQKYQISSDYKERLEKMAHGLDIEDATSLSTLESFMAKQGYRYTYPVFPGGIANFRRVNKNMIEPNLTRRFNRLVYSIKKHIIRFIK